MPYAIGIDLGTTYSCVGVFRNNGVEIIANEIGERTTPSYVAFTDEGVLVGQAAKNQAADNPTCTIFDAKRLIGRDFNDPIVQNDMKSWPFKVVDVQGKPMVEVVYQGQTLLQSPQQISALILGKMKRVAEEFLGEPVRDAVITVPAYFNDSQRQATKDAGMLAGLNVLRIINEPTAAAIAYGLGQCPNVDEEKGNTNKEKKADSNSNLDEELLDFEATLAKLEGGEESKSENGQVQGMNDTDGDSAKDGEAGMGGSNSTINNPLAPIHTDGERIVLVFDLGGGTFDVSLLAIDGGHMEVKATAGDTHLGGEDFDSNIMNYILDEFFKRNKSIAGPIDSSTSQGARALRRLRTACERAKRLLSTSTHASVEIESFWHGVDLKVMVSRSRFESLCKAEMDLCVDPLKQVLSSCKYEPSRIDEVVLVGGSTRIPKIKENIQAFFNKQPNCSLNPDEAVAYGAAVQAAIISNVGSEVTDNLLLVDVAPLSLGIETAGNVMSTFIKRNSTIPVKVTKLYSTDVDNQTAVDIRIFEGERPCTKDNHLLGVVTLDGIPPAPAGIPHIHVTFSINQDGILNVTAYEEKSNKKCAITITNEQGAGRLTNEEIQQMILDAEKFKHIDEAEKVRVRARTGLSILCQQIHGAVKTLKEYLTEQDMVRVLDWMDEVSTWLSNNPHVSRKKYDEKRKKLDRKVDPILSVAYEKYAVDTGLAINKDKTSSTINSNRNGTNNSIESNGDAITSNSTISSGFVDVVAIPGHKRKSDEISSA